MSCIYLLNAPDLQVAICSGIAFVVQGETGFPTNFRLSFLVLRIRRFRTFFSGAEFGFGNASFLVADSGTCRKRVVDNVFWSRFRWTWSIVQPKRIASISSLLKARRFLRRIQHPKYHFSTSQTGRDCTYVAEGVRSQKAVGKFFSGHNRI